jgi:solute carrier family 13 (sodium-dependent dicarboxylate transporter), member 2/3/5
VDKHGWVALGILLAGVGVYFALPESCPEAARRTASVFVVAALFWAFEVIPIYATSLVVVLLLTFLLTRPGGVLGLDHSGYTLFLLPFSSPVIMLFFGGFVLARALRKRKVDRVFASKLLQWFGDRPYFILLGFMVTTGFLSMWISNTATTAMMLAMVYPLLSRIDSDDLFRVGLALAIPFGANIGGVGTPIGTPPNAIALGILADHGIHLNFLSWMLMAVPLAVILMLLASSILFLMFRPKRERVTLRLGEGGQLERKAKGVVVIAVCAILLWLTSGWHGIPEALVALLSAGALFALGFIDRTDLKEIDWDVLVLMWGGLALGKGMQVSGLANWVIGLPIFSYHGFALIAAFCLLAVFLSTFMSNTATANLLIPLAISIPGESAILLAVTVALSCSFAMAFPISTPPNAMAFSTEVIRSRDMFRSGALIALTAVIFILIGFRLVIPRVFGL